MILDSLAATPDLDFHWSSKLAPPCYYEYYNEIWGLTKTTRRCKAFPAFYDAEDRPFRIICTFRSSILIAIEDYSSTLKVDTCPTFFSLELHTDFFMVRIPEFDSLRLGVWNARSGVVLKLAFPTLDDTAKHVKTWAPERPPAWWKDSKWMHLVN